MEDGDVTIVIMAGGRGTRIASMDQTIPKPMLQMAGKPILAYQLECFCRQGYTDIVLVIGHLGHVIMDYFGDGSRFGVSIRYIVEEEPLGTAGALFFLKNMVTEDFLLVNGDIIFDVDIGRFYQYHRAHGHLATIFTHPNDHPYDSALVVADEKGKVSQWIHKEEPRQWYNNCVNAGLHFLSAQLLERFCLAQKSDLDRDVLHPLIAEGELYAYQSPEYVKDMGTPERFHAVLRDLTSGLIAQRNLLMPQKAVFFDRDGTINQYVGFLRNIDDFELIDGIAECIKKANENGYLVIVVTNQPVIARGEITWMDLNKIHQKMETLLGEKGAYIDDIFICPHHPDKGFEGERAEYKIECECRKPKPGMLLEAAKKYNINLSDSYMVGDSKRDMQAAEAAGCTGILINSDAFHHLFLQM